MVSIVSSRSNDPARWNFFVIGICPTVGGVAVDHVPATDVVSGDDVNSSG